MNNDNYRRVDIKSMKIGPVDTGIYSYINSSDGDYYIDANKNIYPSENVLNEDNKEKYAKFFDFDFENIKSSDYKDLNFTPAKIDKKQSIIKGLINIKSIENKNDDLLDNSSNAELNYDQNNENIDVIDSIPIEPKPSNDDKDTNIINHNTNKDTVAMNIAPGNLDNTFVNSENMELQQTKDNASVELEKLNLSADVKENYKNNVLSANDEDSITSTMNSAKNQSNKNSLITGTKIPREKSKYESIEEYEEYLKSYYEPLGLFEKPRYYPNTNIQMPRLPYPHEYNDMYDNNSYYRQLSKYRINKYNEFISDSKKANPDYDGTVKEGQQLAVIEKSNENPPPIVNNDPPTPIINDDPPIKEVKGIRKAINFFKKHKKAIIIGLGLAALAAAFIPGVIPSIMYANSVLWYHAGPFQFLLESSNSFLGGLIHATRFAGEGGKLFWALNGSIINATAASGSILGSLGTSLVTLAGSTAIVGSIRETMRSIKSRIKNYKDSKKTDINSDESQNKNQEEQNDNKEKGLNKDNSKDQSKTDMSNSQTSKNIVEQLKELIEENIENKNKVPQEYQDEIQKKINSLKRALNIIENGKNIPVENTVIFENYRINKNEIFELRNIFNIYNIPYKTKITKEDLESLKGNLTSQQENENSMGGKSR